MGKKLSTEEIIAHKRRKSAQRRERKKKKKERAEKVAQAFIDSVRRNYASEFAVVRNNGIGRVIETPHTAEDPNQQPRPSDHYHTRFNTHLLRNKK